MSALNGKNVGTSEFTGTVQSIKGMTIASGINGFDVKSINQCGATAQMRNESSLEAMMSGVLQVGTFKLPELDEHKAQLLRLQGNLREHQRQSAFDTTPVMPAQTIELTASPTVKTTIQELMSGTFMPAQQRLSLSPSKRNSSNFSKMSNQEDDD